MTDHCKACGGASFRILNRGGGAFVVLCEACGSAVRAEPPLPRGERAAFATLSRADFFARLSAAAALQAGEPPIVDWVKAQIDASGLSPAHKAIFVERIDTAVSFPRIDSDLGDVMSLMGGAVLGLSTDQVDDLFLGDVAVAVNRAACPLPTVPSQASVIAALEARLAALEGAA